MIKNINGHVYYYKSERDGDKVRSVYCGSGAVARLEHALDQVEREHRREEQRRAAAAWRAEQDRLDAIEAPVALHSQAVDRVVRGAFEAAGYHRQRRHRWRRKRKPIMKTFDSRNAGAWDRLPEADRKARFAERAALWERAEKDELPHKDLERFKALVAETTIAHEAGGPGESLKSAIARFQIPNQLGEALHSAWFDAMFAEIAGPDPGPLERMLSFRVICCWGLVNIFERRYLLHAHELSGGKSEAWQRRIDRAHRRFLTAVKVLADIRKLPAATLQTINIAVQQNMGASAGRDGPLGLSESEPHTSISE